MAFDPRTAIREAALSTLRDPKASTEDREAARRALAGTDQDNGDGWGLMSKAEQELVLEIHGRAMRLADGRSGSPNLERQRIATLAAAVAGENGASTGTVCQACECTLQRDAKVPTPGSREWWIMRGHPDPLAPK